MKTKEFLYAPRQKTQSPLGAGMNGGIVEFTKNIIFV